MRQVSEDEAGSLVAKVFGKDVSSVVRLDSYDDANFRINVAGGETFTLKVDKQILRGWWCCAEFCSNRTEDCFSGTLFPTFLCTSSVDMFVPPCASNPSPLRTGQQRPPPHPESYRPIVGGGVCFVGPCLTLRTIQKKRLKSD